MTVDDLILAVWADSVRSG